MYGVLLFLYNMHQQSVGRQNYLFHSRLSRDRYCIITNRHKNYCMRSNYKHVQRLLIAYLFYKLCFRSDRCHQAHE
jgi:hypothetical protein